MNPVRKHKKNKSEKLITIIGFLLMVILGISTPIGKYYVFNLTADAVNLSSLEFKPLAFYAISLPFWLLLQSYFVKYPFNKMNKVFFFIQGFINLVFVIWHIVFTYLFSVAFAFLLKDINDWTILLYLVYLVFIISVSIWSICLATPLSAKRFFNWPFSDELEPDIKMSKIKTKEFKKRHRHGEW